MIDATTPSFPPPPSSPLSWILAAMDIRVERIMSSSTPSCTSPRLTLRCLLA